MSNKQAWVDESKHYTMRFRCATQDLSSVKFYTTKNSIEIEQQISFDREYEPISAIEYFAGSALSSILLTLLEYSRKQGSIIEEIEGVLDVLLENPLTMIGVKGYEEEPFIRKMTVTVFLYANLEDDALNEFCAKALQFSPVYNTLKKAVEFEVIFKNSV
ncbi:hypothetical protein BEP19_09025 [Ammoniphilus oxalaticus]|uniref:OsmC-like protein n=1 Tax=Ammoniphilus oxalaticus TaxID=66863 RepID=A0A419SKR2_9BACL|nr:OsmC family protein [Ammoniphilus oxalaticus]RKD24516.1 hypothetical protein BEP19_09025 [Ammoniphilus oxalaticus]